MRILYILFAFFLIFNVNAQNNNDLDDYSGLLPDFQSKKYKVDSKNDKVGLIRLKDNKLIIPYKYSEIELERDDIEYFKVHSSNNDVGVFSLKDNKEIIPCIYTVISTYSYFDSTDNKHEAGSIPCFECKLIDEGQKRTKTDLYSSVGSLLLSTYDYIDVLYIQSPEIILVTQTSVLNYKSIKAYSVFNTRTGALIKQRQENILDHVSEQFIVKENTGIGVIDVTTDKYIIKPVYDSIVFYSYYRLYKNRNVEVADDKGNVIIPAGTYDNISYYSCIDDDSTCAFSVSKNGKWGCVSTTQKVIIPIRYDLQFNLSNTMWVRNNGKWGMINSNGKEVVPFQFDDIKRCNLYDNKYSSTEYYFVEQNKKWGLFDLYGKLILPVEYDNYTERFTDSTCLSKNGKWGYINLLFEQIIDFKYDTAKFKNIRFLNGNIVCDFNNSSITISKSGNLLNHNDDLKSCAIAKDETGVAYYSLFSSHDDKIAALQYAIDDRNTDLFKLILDYDSTICDYFPICSSVVEKSSDISSSNSVPFRYTKRFVREMIKHGYNVNNCRCSKNRTVLMYWAGSFPNAEHKQDGYDLEKDLSMEFLKFLLEAGADTKAVDAEGNDVLSYYKYCDKDAKVLIKEYMKKPNK
jgi:hypothetical protein